MSDYASFFACWGGSWRLDTWYARTGYSDLGFLRSRDCYLSFRLSRRYA